ncbi:MAG: hypothetical protein GEV11_08465 [Streptosporangiales bacterium]|nr:hypothetical protein [Streptosporangiales bacterium]
MPGMSSPRTTPPTTLRLPWDVLRLAGRFALPLVLWFSAGQVVRYLLVQGMIRVNRIELLEQLHVNRVAAMLLLTLMIILQMAVMVGMLYSVRRGLRSLGDAANERFSVALARSLMPFLVVYFAWNLIANDVFDVVQADMQANFDEDVNDIFASVLGGQPRQNDNPAGQLFILDSLGMPVLLGITTVAWGLRVVCEKWYERSEGRVAGVGMAYFEGAFSLFGIFSITQLIEGGTAWITQRRAWAGTADFFGSLGGRIPGWADFWALFGDFTPHIKDAIGLPLVWLTIAVLVYGVDVEDHRAVISGTRLEAAASRIAGLRGFVQRPLDWITAGSRDKWVPFANALRLILRGGMPLLGLFCLSYAALDFGAEHLWRFAVEQVGGDHELVFWAWAWHPLDFGRQLVVEVLRVALLAATFDLAVRRSEALAAAASPPPPPPAAESAMVGAPR